MNRTEVERRLSERLTDLASYAATTPNALPPMTRMTSVAKPRRLPAPVFALATGTVVILAAAALAVVNVTGQTDSPGRTHTTPGANVPTGDEPTGPAVNTLPIEASNFSFQAKRFDVPAGINEIQLVSVEDSHTLAFADPEFSYVHLSAAPNGNDSAKVDLVEGRTYTIYCERAGPRAAGMEATITVGPAGSAQQFGDASTTTTLPSSSSTGTSG